MDQDEIRTHVRDLPVDSQEEWSVFDTIEVEAIRSACEVESTEEGALVCEKCPVYEVDGLCILWISCQDGARRKDNGFTFPMSIDFSKLK